MNEFDFDMDEFDDEDFAEFDALIEYMKTLRRSEVYVLNPECVLRMRAASALFKRGLGERAKDAKFVCKQDDLVLTTGYIEVEADVIDFCHEEWFLRASGIADDVEIYPLTSHKARVTLGFNKFLVPMK